MKTASLFRFSLIILSVLSFISCNEEPKSFEPPNILFIFADDQTYQGINSLGNPELITPNLDGLVESGVTFTHAYNMGAWGGAVCVASRAMLNSGKMLFRAKVANDTKYDGFLENRMFWSQLLEDQGYDTYMSGKWHVSVDAKKIFNTVGNVRAGMPKTVPESYNRPASVSDKTWLPWHTKYGGYWEGGTHWSEVVANEAIGFIDSSLKSENPFFMYLAFNAPHDPRQSPKEFVDLYPINKVSLPESFLEEYPYKVEMGCPPGLRDEMLAPFPRTPYSVKVHLQEYYAIISHMDYHIGRIIEHLKETGQDNNTYIVFSADHGLGCGKHGLLGKQNMYDHSMRVPLIIAGPDIPENKRIDIQVYLQDLMATTLDIAGVQKPEYVDFNSLMPAIRSEKKDSYYDNIFGSYMNKQRMIRNEKYKLIFYPEAAVYRLYDMENDPEELNDIALQKGSLPIIKDLSYKIRQLQREQGDTLNLTRFYPSLFKDIA